MGLLSRRFSPGSRPKALVSPIGLEFAEEQLNLVQLESASPPLIRASASLPYPMERTALLQSPPALRAFLKRALAAAPFAGRKVVSALSAGDVRILSVTYQAKPNETDDQAIARLMEERVGEDLQQFVIDYVLVRGEHSDSDRRAIVLLSERGTVTRYLDSLVGAGLDVEALEVGPVAIKRLVATLIEAGQTAPNTLVVNTGERRSYLTMVSGQRLLFDEEIDFGEGPLLEQIGLALDVERDVARSIVFRHGLGPGAASVDLPPGVDDTASTNTVLMMMRPHFVRLAGELRRAMTFAASETRGGSVGRVFLMGSLARWPGADSLLRGLLEVPVTVPTPLPFAAARDAGDRVPHPELVVAAGLALRGFLDRA